MEQISLAYLASVILFAGVNCSPMHDRGIRNLYLKYLYYRWETVYFLYYGKGIITGMNSKTADYADATYSKSQKYS